MADDPLPDDLSLEETEIFYATWTVLKGHAQTVGDVRRMSDAELLAISRFGPIRLAEVRRLFGRADL